MNYLYNYIKKLKKILFHMNYWLKGRLKKTGPKPSSCVQRASSRWILGPVGSCLGSALDCELSFELYLLLHPVPAVFFLITVSNFMFSSNAIFSWAFFFGLLWLLCPHCPWNPSGTCRVCQVHSAQGGLPDFLSSQLSKPAFRGAMFAMDINLRGQTYHCCKPSGIYFKTKTVEIL